MYFSHNLRELEHSRKRNKSLLSILISTLIKLCHRVLNEEANDLGVSCVKKFHDDGSSFDNEVEK